MPVASQLQRCAEAPTGTQSGGGHIPGSDRAQPSAAAHTSDSDVVDLTAAAGRTSADAYKTGRGDSESAESYVKEGNSTYTMGTMNRPREYIDWVGDYRLFAIIVTVVETEKSWRGAIQRLRTPAYCGQFDRLNESTLRGWFDRGTYRLKSDIRQKWHAGDNNLVRANNHRPYFLSQHRELENSIKSTLNGMRMASCVVNSFVVHAVMNSYLHLSQESALNQMSLSRRYCRYWVQHHMGWTYKKATTSGQKLPLDWEHQVQLMFHRISAITATHDITQPEFIINWDQTAVSLMPTQHHAYHNKSEKQVPVLALDDKRQITAVVASAMTGELLPLQLIFGGQDKNKKQQKSVPKLQSNLSDEVLQQEQFHLTQTKTHWSTLDSMQDYVRKIIVPYVNRCKHKLNCAESHTLLLIDCWSVHKSREFLDWIKQTYPTFHVVFVPAGCTGKAQPADVILQRSFKHEITKQYTQWVMTETETLIKTGIDPELIRIECGLGIVKPLAVEWAYRSWKLLTANKHSIAIGWNRMGFDNVLKPEFQMQSMKLVLNDTLSLEPNINDRQIETSGISWSDWNAIEQELSVEDCEENIDDTDVENNTDILLVQLMKEVDISTSTSSGQELRRSPRINRTSNHIDRRLALTMQEQLFQNIE